MPVAMPAVMPENPVIAQKFEVVPGTAQKYQLNNATLAFEFEPKHLKTLVKPKKLGTCLTVSIYSFPKNIVPRLIYYLFSKYSL